MSQTENAKNRKATEMQKNIFNTWLSSFLLFTGMTWFLVVTGCETPKQETAIKGNLVLSSSGQVDSKKSPYTSTSLVLKASGWDQEAGAPADVSSTLRLDSGPGPVIPHRHGEQPVKTWPLWHHLHLLDGDQKPWVSFDPMHKEVTIFKDLGAGTGVPLNIVNRDYTELGLRFVKSDVPHPWILHIPDGKENFKFVLLRDWLFSAIIWDEEGRTLMGRLSAHPPANAPAKARVNIRGHEDEVQFLVEADKDQTAPLMQISDHGNTESYVTVGPTGQLGLGAQDPQNILTVKRDSGTDPVADAWTVYSSKRWKTNIKPIKGALDTIKDLRGVSFDWKESGKKDIGLVAEEVAKVIPEVVSFDEQSAHSVD